MTMRPTHNARLRFIRDDWKGNPLNQRGRYINLDGPSERGYGDLLKWKASTNPLKSLKKNQQPGIRVIKNPKITGDREDGVIWLGHASYLITLAGRHLITDPVFGNVSFLKRYTPLPCAVNDLSSIDFILLSHNHRDHCDQKSLQALCALNPGTPVLTGLETTSLLRKWNIQSPVQEAGWYQVYETEDDIRITYLPAKHWCRRGLRDLNEMLWGSFMIEWGTRKIYFGADSGMGLHFEDIGRRFGEIDYAFLGIGAYKPEWFMHPSHTGPADAIRASRMLGAKKWVPMHHGTFDLSDEPVFYPRQVLLNLLRTEGSGSLLDLPIGEKHYFD